MSKIIAEIVYYILDSICYSCLFMLNLSDIPHFKISYNMSKHLLVACFMLTMGALSAQEKEREYPKPEAMSPGMTEFWLPRLKEVAPADIDGVILAAPSDAIVLYDGSTTSEWVSVSGDPVKWVSEDGVLTVVPGSGDIKSVREFDDFQLHIEWRVPGDSENAERGNSGIYLQGLYEIQIIDTHQSPTYSNGQTGSIYKQAAPLVDALQESGKWNSFDIIYHAPIFKGGKMAVKPTVTILHNGVLVQDHTVIQGTTEYIGLPREVEHGAGPILLQEHGDKTSFRNIWIREL